MGSRVAQIASAIEQIAVAGRNMEHSISQVAAVAEQSSASLEQVSASTQETTASTERVAASAGELATTAKRSAARRPLRCAIAEGCGTQVEPGDADQENDPREWVRQSPRRAKAKGIVPSMSMLDTTQLSLIAAMRGSLQRQALLTNNLANVDTPGLPAPGPRLPGDAELRDPVRPAAQLGDLPTRHRRAGGAGRR